MNSEAAPEFRPDLLDDFYAEADEHLGSIRTQLALLEASAGKSAPDRDVLDALFRSVHSLKGISAMAGLRGAEAIAHAMEDHLREISRQRAVLSGDELEAFFSAWTRLEQSISAHRLRQAMPASEDVVRHLASLRPDRGTAPIADPASAGAEAGGDPPDPVAAARARGLALWRCTFLPSRELDARGVNINTIRSRLSAAGEILRSTPAVRAGSKIAFEFVVALREAPPDTWREDGLELEPFTENTAAGAAPAAAEAERTAGLFVAPSHLVRVDLSRLDELMRITGEMVIHRSRLEDRLAALGGDTSAVREVSHALARSLKELRVAITRVRLVPVAEIFARMNYVVRDLARDTGKQVRLVLQGQHTEIDKYVGERLKEPLLHLVRNAFSHGIELPGERAAAGKPAEATILLRALPAGDFVVLEVEDDGRGIDPAAIRARAVELGYDVPAQLDEPDVLRLLCEHGFSTRAEADRTAGRGVGMAVVHNTVRELGGSLGLRTTPGRGTQFTLRLPLTLSIVETVIVSAANQICAIPQGSIQEIVQVAANTLRTIKEADVIPYRDGLLPVLRLRSLFRQDDVQRRPLLTVVVLTSGRGSVGLIVDRVHTQREVVTRPLSDPLLQVPGISGATELGDGRPVLILDPLAIAEVVRPPGTAAPAAS